MEERSTSLNEFVLINFHLFHRSGEIDLSMEVPEKAILGRWEMVGYTTWNNSPPSLYRNGYIEFRSDGTLKQYNAREKHFLPDQEYEIDSGELIYYDPQNATVFLPCRFQFTMNRLIIESSERVELCTRDTFIYERR